MQTLVVDAEEGVEGAGGLLGVLDVDGGTHLLHLYGALLLLGHEAVGGGGLVAVHAIDHLAAALLADNLRVVGLLHARAVAENAHGPVTHLIGAHVLTFANGPYAALNSHILFGLVAKRFTACNLTEVITSPALDHHQ